MSKFEPGTVEKKSSTIGPPAGIEPTPVRCRCTALTIHYAFTLAPVNYLRSLVRHRTGVGSIPAGGPIVDEFFSTVPG